MKDVKVTWVLWDDITPGKRNASSRVRGGWVAKHMPNTDLCSDSAQLNAYDVIIYQKRFESHDLEMASILKHKGKVVIFDITDPEWNPDYQHYDSKKAMKVRQMTEICDVTVVPTEFLYNDFKEHFPQAPCVVIPDRIDLDLYTELKDHDKSKPPYIILWHGCTSNTGAVELAREDLEKLGKEYKLRLICVYGPTMDGRIKPFENLELIQTPWSQLGCTKLLASADIAINPRFNDIRRYKSNNKTVAAHACGVPCVERDFYKTMKRYLENPNLRKSDGLSGRQMIEMFYDSALSAKDYMSLIKHMLTPPAVIKTPKKIAIYSCITGGTDDVVTDLNREGADLIMYTDTYSKALPQGLWEYRQVPGIMKDSRRESRMIKWLAHKFVEEYTYSLWIDGNIRLDVPVEELIEKYLKNSNIAVFYHGDRDCVYEEGMRCRLEKLDDPQLIEEQMSHYAQRGLPKHIGLSELPVVLRRHVPEIERFNEAVWAEYCRWSRRDQLCFDYVLWKHKISVGRFPGKASRKKYNPYFDKNAHTKDNRRIQDGFNNKK